MRVLIIGGAGYIGSHMVKLLGQQNCSVTTLDDLSYGHRDAVLYGDFVQGNFGDSAVLDAVLAKGLTRSCILPLSFRWASRCNTLTSTTVTT